MNPILVWFLGVSCALWLAQSTLLMLYRAFGQPYDALHHHLKWPIGFITRNQWGTVICLVESLLVTNILYVQQSEVIHLNSFGEAVGVALLLTCGALLWMLLFYPIDRAGDWIESHLNALAERWTAKLKKRERAK